MNARARHVPITWDELLRMPHRQLRRVLADRYHAAARADRIEDAHPVRLPPAMVREWRREISRLNDSAAACYEEMYAGYPERARAQYAAKQKPKGPGPRVAPLDEFVDLVDLGESPDMALKRLGTTRGALEMAARRHDRRDVLDLLGIQRATENHPTRQEAPAA